MTTLNLQVAANADDAQEQFSPRTLTISPSGGFIRIETAPAPADIYSGGFRFTNVTIPPGSTITAAALSLYFNPVTDDMSSEVRANDVDNANDFVTEAAIYDRALTVAYVTWYAFNFGAGWEASPDLSAVIQEVIDRAGWSSGNAMAIVCRGGLGGAVVALVEDYSHSAPVFPAKLDITYTTPAAGPFLKPIKYL